MDPIFMAGTGLVALGLVVWIVCVVVAYRNAPKRGRGPITWAILTVIFGPLALFALYAMAPKPGARAAEHRDPRADLYQVPKKKG